MHLYVRPPNGMVTVSAPLSIQDASIALFVRTKLSWIKKQIAQFEKQERQSEREYVSGEALYVWGKRYYLEVSGGSTNSLELSGSKALLTVRKNSTVQQRERFVREWYRSILKPVRNADAFEQCAVAVFARGESTEVLYQCALEIGTATEDPELYTKGIAWALSTNHIVNLRQLIQEYNNGIRRRQDLLAVFAQKIAPESAYTDEAKEQVLEQAKTALAAAETKRHTTYITALKLSDEIGVKKACEQLNVNYGRYNFGSRNKAASLTDEFAQAQTSRIIVSAFRAPMQQSSRIDILSTVTF